MADTKMSKIFPNPPSVSYRQPRNLKKILVRSTLKQLPFRDFSDQLPQAVIDTCMGEGGGNVNCVLNLRKEKFSKATIQGYHIRSDTTSHVSQSTVCILSHATDVVSSTQGSL